MKLATRPTPGVKPLLTLLCTIALLPPTASAAPSSVNPVELRCENLANPLGIDVPAPRLSWQLQPKDPADRGQHQSAFHIRAASSPELLETGRPDLWDSGWHEDNTDQHTTYQGKSLTYPASVHWQIRVRDHKGRTSPWSQPAHWTLGPSQPSDWSGSWIGPSTTFTRQPGWPPPDNTMPDPWFRKTLDLPAQPAHAYIHVASVGYHEVYVNGQRIGDQVLAPCVSDLSQRTRFVTYDITPQLRPGRNAIGLWLGTSWSIFPPMAHTNRPSAPIVLAQADISLKNNQPLQLSTDASWKTHPSPNTLLGVWDFMHFGGELYDANLEIPDWCDPDLDDSAWQTATTYEPRLIVSAQSVEPNRLQTPITPKAIEEVWPGTWRIDMGVNFAGWIEIPLHGDPGSNVEILWSERSDEEMTHRLHSTYILGPSGKGTFRNRFNYGSGRWITVKGAKLPPNANHVRAWTIRSDFPRSSSFKCSNPTLNNIYNLTLHTLENLTLGGYVVDCPQRERMGYGGDAHATIQTALDNYRATAFYEKWSQDWRDVQGKQAAWGVATAPGQPGAISSAANHGNLPYTAPTYWGGGGPAWSGFCITLPWEVFRRQADPSILAQNWNTITQWLEFLETKSQNNLLQRWGGEWDFLGDWLWPKAEGVNGDTRETLFFNNCYWVHNLETAAKIADHLNHQEQALAWRARAHRVRNAIHKEFHNPADHSYVDGSQSAIAIALAANVPPLELQPAVETRLRNEILNHRQGHFWGGITGGAFIVKYLTDTHQSELLYTMATQPDYPGWAHMLSQGATTAWEDWEGNLSRLHSSYLHIGSWFIQGLGGIRPNPNGKGFSQFSIQPDIWTNCPLTHVEASTGTPFGTIQSHWKRHDQTYTFSLNIPPGTTAQFILPPSLGYCTITENNRPLHKIKGITHTSSNSGKDWILTLEPGNYTFDVNPAAPIQPKQKTYIPGHL
ncbi:MAG: hypothetical protein RI897_2302 [Verrucomicrobiota bacterium]